MTDYDTIWRTQDEIRTVVNAVLGECIWDLRYNDRRMGTSDITTDAWSSSWSYPSHLTMNRPATSVASSPSPLTMRASVVRARSSLSICRNIRTRYQGDFMIFIYFDNYCMIARLHLHLQVQSFLQRRMLESPL